MVDIKELRIGNLVLTKYNSIYKVDSISSTGIGLGILFGQWDETDKSEIFPITLTKEWLFDFGFIRNEDIDINGYAGYTMPGIAIDVFINSKGNVCVHFFEGALYKHPQYIHELQNAYFVLIGTELKLEYEKERS